MSVRRRSSHPCVGLRPSYGTGWRQVVSLLLIPALLGCQGVYRFRLHSLPSGAAVSIDSEFKGTTPCNIRLARDSPLIKDHHITVTLHLPDGREVSRVLDLRDYETNRFAQIAGGVFAVPGLLLLALCALSSDDDGQWYDDSDDEDERLVVGLAGLGLLAAGALTFWLFGGDSADLEGHEVLILFDDPNEITPQPGREADL